MGKMRYFRATGMIFPKENGGIILQLEVNIRLFPPPKKNLRAQSSTPLKFFYGHFRALAQSRPFPDLHWVVGLMVFCINIPRLALQANPFTFEHLNWTE
jgi:hypothetical protein